MENIFKTTVETPIGYLELTTNHDFLLSVSFTDTYLQSSGYQPNIIMETVRQIGDYFKGILKVFVVLMT